MELRGNKVEVGDEIYRDGGISVTRGNHAARVDQVTRARKKMERQEKG